MILDIKMIKTFQAVDLGGLNSFAFVVGSPSGPDSITLDTDTNLFEIKKIGKDSVMVPMNNVPFFRVLRAVNADKIGDVVEPTKRGRSAKPAA